MDSRILVALDVPTAEDAVRLARDLSPHVAGFKIGLGLLYGPGPATVAALAEVGKPVFADAKLHDIPSQVERAARRLAALGARWITAHASGGVDMLAAAVSGAASAGTGSGILAVTVLTSLDGADVERLAPGSTPGKLTSRLAKSALAGDCEGVICSARELGVIAQVGPDLLKVTPGIRPAGTEVGDQERTMTPAEAVERGADYLVIGRPITEAADPVAAATDINRAVES
ncbi:MAG: orotidine-5'-phosphate decarboxylase [Acidimicrobiia bacterium]|nr:orotidine-5'-phosphate decarboxylase [Acidimicrobiia bacterium]MBT8192211.1 orotidine-5'-phosphate decarboxylase [Acidimicrobiia bacterium]MBT8248326.1 orotidine-5'-phosphate decarboxylase [Acidimicrobiia bacterium]NNF88790.1 orotidine-5'-phosphate decarboxylase [Acidimicrobiia bacterium]NNJ47315.1 orotidine-5'-phosphate decarboxylase [Acidimicrobiia bacterium]